MSRRRKSLLGISSKDLKVFRTSAARKAILIILFFASTILFFYYLFNSKTSEQSDACLIFLISAVFSLFLFLRTTSFFKGKIGEFKVSRRLKRLAKKYNGFLINDVTIPDEDSNKTSQIDHILITRFGIFVVETKNYSGYIYGNDNQLEWTQVLKYGKEKHKLYNPVKQNATHCYRLKGIIKNENLSLTSIVVFVNFSGGSITSKSVIMLSQIRKLITKTSPVLYSDQEIFDAYTKIKFYKENPIISNKEHIKEIRDNLNNINNNICPRCGGNLVLRKSKNGNEFYGCENYPKCTFTKR